MMDDPQAAVDASTSFERRLASLERDARRWRMAAAALGTALAVVLLGGPAPVTGAQDVASIVVRQPGSAARVQLTAEDGVPALGLYDAQGILRVGVSVEPDGPQWNLFAADGQVRVVAGQRDGAAFLIVRDAEGAPRAAMAVQENGEPSLYLLDANLNPLFRKP